MKLFTSIVLGPALVVGLTAGSAFAQETTTTSSRSSSWPMRGYLIGGGGATVNGVAQTNLMISGEIAENMTSTLQAYMSAVYYDNLISPSAQNDLNAVGAFLTASTGLPWQFDGRVRGRSFTAGAKYQLPLSYSVRPYVGGGIGVLNLKRFVNERSRGDLTEAFALQFPGSGDGIVDITESNTNKPIAEAAAGVGAVVGHAYVDFGYRYRKAFHTDNQSFHMSQVGFSAGVRF